MDKEEKGRPFLVLGDLVQDFAYVDQTAFQLVTCRRQEAYGCGQSGHAIVRGLSLFVRLGREDDPYDNPKLCLSASDKVFQTVGMEIDNLMADVFGRDICLSGRIYTVDVDVMVICVSFGARCSLSDFRSYYLVYDSAAQSMFLLSHQPPFCWPICTTLPLKVDRPICTTSPLKVGSTICSTDYSLVLMAQREIPSSSSEKIICLWSTDDRRDCSRSPWSVKARGRFKAEPSFEAKVVFVFKGNAVWADLAQGIMYCDCHVLIDGTGPVDFKHIELPTECRVTDDLNDLGHCSLDVYRNMGCVGDSIWFVMIEPNLTCPRDTVVKVWTLASLLSEEEKWNPIREFKVLELFKAAEGLGLPETVPRFPILMQQDDGAFYMLLPELFAGGGVAYGHLACIDLSSSSCEVRLRSSRRLAIPLMTHPVALDPNFFPTTYLER